MRASEKVYLYEVQGLRTLAALMVAVYHIWFQRVSGGVDVFFVVAAFFMALSLTKNENLAWSNISRYYMNTLRRVLPNTVVVIVFSVLGLILLSPNVIWEGEIINAVGSALFIENLILAFKSSNYLNQGLNSSIFQQMWAISIQMQLYFTIPLVIYLVSAISLRKKSDFRKNLVKVFLVIFLCSLTYSVYRTSVNQPFTYYDTIARVWEFSIGVLLALLLAKLNFKNNQAALIGFLGLIALVSFAAFFDVSTQFPGFLALVPCLAACAIIISSSNGSTIPLLSSKVFIRLADYSFGFYLWHWPLLTLYRQYFRVDQIAIIPGILIISFALILSIISTKFAEKPFRNNKSLKASEVKTLSFSLGFISVALISTAFLIYSWNSASTVAEKELAEFIESDHQTDRGSAIYPDPVIARNDLPSAYDDGCHQNNKGDVVLACTYGDESSDKVLVVVGGSHSLQWLPALDLLGQENGFKIINMTKSACIFSSSDPGLLTSKASISSCMRWNKNVLDAIVKLKPHAVFTIGTRVIGGEELVPLGYIDAWRNLEGVGINIVVVRDNPWFGFDVPSCVDFNPDVDSCAITRDSYYRDKDPLSEINSVKFHRLDLVDLFCGEKCPVVIDNILVYRDKHHLTKTFVVHHRNLLKNVLRDVGVVAVKE
jgi:peptidoglycan/LPS O-acetylase OafA/YrhL